MTQSNLQQRQSDASAITQRAIDAQRLAAAPQDSAFVMASAGSGKTKVLTDRILRLLLDGVLPSRILCLTFTKAAAAEMSNRLLNKLSDWVSCSQQELVDDLQILLGQMPTDKIIDKARRLFAFVLDVPGGMKIQNIHSFSQLVLSQFPLEAGLLPHFKVLDEVEAEAIKAAALQDVLIHAQADSELSKTMQYLTVRLELSSLQRLVGSVWQYRGQLEHMFTTYDDHQLWQEIAAQIGYDGQLPNVIWAELDEKKIKALSEALRVGGKSDLAAADKMDAWLTVDDRWDQRDLLLDALLTKSNKKREPRKQLPTKKVKESAPNIEDMADVLKQQLMDFVEHENQYHLVERTAAFLHFARVYLTFYDQRKALSHGLDFDDLILATKRLLSDPSRAAWVHYKLDGGIDHLLVDEAQDTSYDQWTLVKALADDYFSGVGQKDVVRTVFAVGDKKQSIYRFQNADPAAFSDSQNYFQDKATQVGQIFSAVNLDVSFRSTPAVLDAVDATFNNTDAHQGLFDRDLKLKHLPNRMGSGGRVMVWPLAPPMSFDKDASSHQASQWELPHLQDPAMPTETRVAHLVAAQIEALLESKKVLAATGKPIQPGDIMILLRRRTKSLLTHQIVAQLKRRDIPVSGLDRLVLNDQLAVQDLLNIANFICLPEDDFSLACALKSPLIGFSEDDLFELSFERSASLWESLQDKAAHKPHYKDAVGQLQHWQVMANQVCVYDFFAQLVDIAGRKKIVTRLGPQAHDVLDEFLLAALKFDKQHGASLQGFVHWMQSETIEIKRDMSDANLNQVRLMTVHGAKGLQAPIVILPDTTSLPDPKVDFVKDDTFVYWLGGAARDPAVANQWRKQEREQEMAEYYRLLYVAMTRAEDELHVMGWQDAHGRAAKGSWYDVMQQGIGTLCEAAPIQIADLFHNTKQWGRDWQGDALVYELPQERAVLDASTSDESTFVDLPNWLKQQPMTSGFSVPELRPLQDTTYAQMYGSAMHALLQVLPTVLPRQYDQVAAAVLKQWPDLQVDHIMQQVKALLSDANLQDVWTKEALTEVDLAGKIENEIVVRRIDRLILTDNMVWIIDFKTDKHPPNSMTDVPAKYREQLQDYKQLLQQCYADREYRLSFLWTTSGQLMDV